AACSRARWQQQLSVDSSAHSGAGGDDPAPRQSLKSFRRLRNAGLDFCKLVSNLLLASIARSAASILIPTTRPGDEDEQAVRTQQTEGTCRRSCDRRAGACRWRDGAGIDEVPPRSSGGQRATSG